MNTYRRSWIAWVGSALVGVACAAASIFWGPPASWFALGLSAIQKAYELVGITLIGLAPLGIWSTIVVARQIMSGHPVTSLTELNYAYVTRNATLLGLLGTVIALASAGGSLAASVSKGSSAAILQITPMVSQALISTVVGIVIALIADTGLHLVERRRAKENLQNQTGVHS